MNSNNEEVSNEITTEIVNETVKEICTILNKADENLTYDFIECLFTPAELKNMANRWLLVKELEKGTTQREIAKKFGISLCKITRGSRELQKSNSAFRRMLNILAETQNNN